jgi:hypothetical protein
VSDAPHSDSFRHSYWRMTSAFAIPGGARGAFSGARRPQTDLVVQNLRNAVWYARVGSVSRSPVMVSDHRLGGPA